MKRILRLYHWSPRGKVVLITGASSGIGEELAYEFARRGSRLVLVARRKEKLMAIAEKCHKLGAAAVQVCPADVAVEEDSHRMVNETIDNFGRLDVLVLNASIAPAFLFDDAQTLDAIKPIVDVNLLGYVLPTLSALEHLRRVNGHILVTASSGAYIHIPRFSIYNASKIAEVQFFDTLRSEIGNSVGITVVFPGVVASELTSGKFLSESGEMRVDSDRRDELIGPFPMLTPYSCAKSMVNAACRGDDYLIVPMWVGAILLLRILAWEVLDWSFSAVLLPWSPGKTAPSKTLVETLGAHKWAYDKPATEPETVKANN